MTLRLKLKGVFIGAAACAWLYKFFGGQDMSWWWIYVPLLVVIVLSAPILGKN